MSQPKFREHKMTPVSNEMVNQALDAFDEVELKHIVRECLLKGEFLADLIIERLITKGK